MISFFSVHSPCMSNLSYNLCHRVVNHDNIYQPDYGTISRQGVTRVRVDDETEFISVSRWEQEYYFFKKLTQVKFCTFL